MKSKPLKLKVFCQKKLAEGITRPTDIKAEYERAYPNIPAKSLEAYIMTLKRLGATKEVRAEIVQAERKKQAELDILEYGKVRSYLLGAKRDGLTQTQIDRQMANLRKLWVIMGKTNPDTWTEEAVMEAVMKAYPMELDDRNVNVFIHPASVKALLSPFNTIFQGVLRKNWTANLCKHKAGELKDFYTFYELDEFLSKLTDTERMSLEGWQALFRTHINTGGREGTEGNTGILGLLWEDINFTTKRCSMREKGHRGNAGERWENVPLDLFKFLHGWDYLITWHKQQGEPRKGKVFPIAYSTYNDMFHATRHKCQSRISEDSDTQRLHIFRRTHGMYCQRLGLRLEFICGDAPEGRFGVGWKDPKIPRKYYLSSESEEIEPKELAFMQAHLEDYGFVLAQMQKTNAEIKALLGIVS